MGPLDPSVAHLVERQMRNWELARQQRLATPEPRRAEIEPFLCVSRMVGIDDRIARGLGEGLGWPVFDKRILEAMAGDDRSRLRVYESMDECDLSWWEEAIAPLLIGREFTRNDYLHRLGDTLLSLARQGSCVFVGRGADRVLPRDRGFRVRLVAPVELRERWLAEERGLTEAAASAELERLEERRRRFLQRSFRVDADDPVAHDLVLNLEKIGPGQAIEIILGAARAAGLEVDRQVRRRVS